MTDPNSGGAIGIEQQNFVDAMLRTDIDDVVYPGSLE